MVEKSTFFQVEVNFGKGDGWQRNGQKHPKIETAKHMASFFTKMADVRLVKRTEAIEEEVIEVEK